MKVLKIVTVNNENYQIVKLERKEGILEIYFIWGKTDFRTVWLYSDSVWIRKKLQIFKKVLSGLPIKIISYHGIALEETYWEEKIDDLFITLPSRVF